MVWYGMVCSEVEQSLFLWYQSFFHLIVLALRPHSHKGHSTNLFQQRCFSYAIFPFIEGFIPTAHCFYFIDKVSHQHLAVTKKCKHIFSKWSKENTEEQEKMFSSRNWNIRMKINKNRNKKTLNGKWRVLHEI